MKKMHYGPASDHVIRYQLRENIEKSTNTLVLLNHKDDKITEMRNEINSLKQENGLLKAEINNTDSNQVEILTAERDDCKESNEKLIEVHSDLVSEYKNFRALHKQCTMSDNQYKVALLENDKIRSENNRLKTENTALSMKLSRISAEISQ